MIDGVIQIAPNPPTIRLHAGIFANLGVENCDFRGPAFIGKEQGDHHSTVLELDQDGKFIFLNESCQIDITQEEFDEFLAAALTFGKKLNKILSRASLSVPIVGGKAALRLGVWDKTPPA